MKKILSLATPLIISQLISMALVLTDVWMMAKLSVADLAGGGLGASVYTFVFLVAGSTVGCVANLIAPLPTVKRWQGLNLDTNKFG